MTFNNRLVINCVVIFAFLKWYFIYNNYSDYKVIIKQWKDWFTFYYITYCVFAYMQWSKWTVLLILVVTIAFGVHLPTAMVDDAAKYVIYAYSAAFVLVQLILEVFNRKRKHSKSRISFAVNSLCIVNVFFKVINMFQHIF